MKKAERQRKIEQLIKQNVIATQDELMRQLEANGIKATQATISRDIRELQIIKEQDSNGVVRYVIFKGNNQNEEEKLIKAIEETVVDIRQVEFMNIIHTLPRNANVLAAILDGLSLPTVAGTLAGYDTVVIISGSKDEASQINSLFTKHVAEQ